ncbi:unnamed protein product [Urochloa decumbens]|uniref:Uncharacterized protein n=1 Tax=Urochloa decumbens TaxID=240449 RepID=A0ABC9A556_9POAL
MDYTTTAWAAAAGLALLALFSYLTAAARRGSRTRPRYPPVSGTVFHKLYHLRRLHDYLTDLSRRHKTFRLLAPGRRRLVYTCDPAAVAARQDMLSRFMEAAASSTAGGDGSAAVDYRYLRDMVLNILIAGKDTTVEALAWFFYMACKHPRVQERIYHEAGEASGGAGEGVPVEEFARGLTDEALNKMHYLHAALTEALRLYTALPLNNKECFSDDVLPGGFRLYAAVTPKIVS